MILYLLVVLAETLQAARANLNPEYVPIPVRMNTVHSKLEEVWYYMKGSATISVSGKSNIQLWQ